jgi:hypothetical protein
MTAAEARLPEVRRSPAHAGTACALVAAFIGYGFTRTLCAGPTPPGFLGQGMACWTAGLAAVVVAWLYTRPRPLGVWVQLGAPALLLLWLLIHAGAAYSATRPAFARPGSHHAAESAPTTGGQCME